MDARKEFARWLKKNNLQTYRESLEEEGYDDLMSLSMIPSCEVDELCTTLKMKPGHKRKMAALMAELSRDMQLKQKEAAVKDAEKEHELSRRMRKIEAKEKRVRKKAEGQTDKIAAHTRSAHKISLPHGKR